MASMQCHKVEYEACEETRDNSLGHKIAENIGWGTRGNHHGYSSGHALANSQSHRYGESYGYGQKVGKPHGQYYSPAPAHYEQHTMAQGHTLGCGETDSYYVNDQTAEYGQSYGQGNGHGYGQGYGHGYGHPGQHGNTETIVQETYVHKKKEKGYGRKSRDCDRSCSDSDSDCD